MGQKKAEAAPFLPLNKKPPPGMPAGVFNIRRKGAVVLSGVRMAIKNYKGLKKQLDDTKKAPQKVMRALYSDARKRVPGWVATEITEVYGVKKTEITGKKIGDVKVQGSDIKSLKVVYTGRPLTHTHFSMSPKAPKEGGSYTLKATVIKGQRKTLGNVKKLTKAQRAALAKNFTSSGAKSSEKSPIMLMRANGGQYLPFQRKSSNRNDIDVVKTISLPQMVSSERTSANIQQAINDGLGKRMDHHMKRYMGK